MLNPEKAGPDNPYQNLPPELSEPGKAEQLPLLQPPAKKEHAPLLRHEWSKRQKALAWALGFATITTLANMADNEGRAIYDGLRGHSEFATVQVEAQHQDGDILDQPIGQDGVRFATPQKQHHHGGAATESPMDLLTEREIPDFTELAKDADKDPNVPPLPDDFPRTKLPGPIDINTPADAFKNRWSASSTH